MAQLFESTATITTTERSLPSDTTTGVPVSRTEDAQLQGWLDLTALAAGDEFELALYEKVNGTGATQRKTVLASFVGKQEPIFLFPALNVFNGWDVTLKKIAGTDRAIGWSLRGVLIT
jgi:hypothetical protein